MEHTDCRHLLADLPGYVAGEASEAICAEIERHMAECEDCRVVVDTLRQTVELYRRLPQPAFPEAARERLYRALDLGQFLNSAYRGFHNDLRQGRGVHPLRSAPGRRLNAPTDADKHRRTSIRKPR